METGVGLTGNPYASPPDYGSNPQAMLSWSDDGGHTYSSTYTASLGLTGQYKARVIFNKLGVSRDRVFKFSMSDPVKANIIGGYAK